MEDNESDSSLENDMHDGEIEGNQNFDDDHLISMKTLEKRYKTSLDFEHPSRSKGLSPEEAKSRLEKLGKNRLTPPKQMPEILKFLRHFTNLFMILLMVAGILTMIVFGLDTSNKLNLWVGVVLFVVVILTCIFSYYQERSTNNTMKSIKNMLPPQCKVIRKGSELSIKAEELVIGDVVHVQMGDKVPADIRLIECKELKVEASSLTGESDAILCSTESEEKDRTESNNLIWNSSLVIEGDGHGVVISTGDNTLIGKISTLVTKTGSNTTLLEKEIRRSVYFISVIAFLMALTFFIVGMARGLGFKESLLNGFIIVFVANVPQGLPATVTSILTIAAKRLSSRNVFVKRLDSVETLGSATVIATDKTGTLTENKMSVSHLWYDFDIHTAESQFNADVKSINNKNSFPHLYRIAALCNRAVWEGGSDDTFVKMDSVEHKKKKKPIRESMENRPNARKSFEHLKKKVDIDGMTTETNYSDLARATSIDRQRIFEGDGSMNRNVIGDASETALFRFCNTFQDIETYQYKHSKVFEIPFNSKNKWQLSIHKWNHSSSKSKKKSTRILVMKGAPEIIFSKCSHIMENGKKKELTKSMKKRFERIYFKLGSFGERVLGFAELELDSDIYDQKMDKKYSQEKQNYPMEGLCFVGLISLIDPPRKGVAESINQCRDAGVRVIMVTGDHPFTAESIARKVGIIDTFMTKEEIAKNDKIKVEDVPEDQVEAVVVHGHMIHNFTEEDWDRILSKREIVFARTSPEQKLLIVENLQRLGEIVAVTGDGVNDSPALRKSDIGVAMGKCGSDVAKEAADVLLYDDNFMSLVTGVKEGRLMFDNLTKTVAYTISHSMPEIIPIFLNFVLGMPLGINPLLLLAIDLGTELGPAISLAYEKMEDNVMERPPRNAKKDRIFSLPLVFYTYVQIGVINTCACILSYVLVFKAYDISPSFLLYTKHFKAPWTSFELNGTTYTEDMQKNILADVQTAWFATLVLGQFAHIWMCKTRSASLFTHGIGNIVMIFGVLVELLLMFLIVYVPKLNHFFGAISVTPIIWTSWLISLGAMWIWVEGRKAWCRKYPDGIATKLFSW